jgi:hypothetical protein
MYSAYLDFAGENTWDLARLWMIPCEMCDVIPINKNDQMIETNLDITFTVIPRPIHFPGGAITRPLARTLRALDQTNL